MIRFLRISFMRVDLVSEMNLIRGTPDQLIERRFALGGARRNTPYIMQQCLRGTVDLRDPVPVAPGVPQATNWRTACTILDTVIHHEALNRGPGHAPSYTKAELTTVASGFLR